MKEITYKFKKIIFMITFIFILETLSIKEATFIDDIINKKEYDKYDDIIKEYVKLLKKFNIKKPDEIFSMTYYFLNNGYFSNGKFEYSLKRLLLLKNYGLDCIFGEGVCLNETELLTDIYNSFGYEAETISGNVNKDYGHSITKIKYNDNYYYYDITNNTMLMKKGNIYYPNEEYVFNYELLDTLLSNNLNFRAIDSYYKSRLKDCSIDEFDIELDDKTVELIKKDLDEFISNNKDKIEDLKGEKYNILLRQYILYLLCAYINLVIFDSPNKIKREQNKSYKLKKTRNI